MIEEEVMLIPEEQPTPSAAPEETPAPVEVISVDELLGRLQEAVDTTQEVPLPEETEIPEETVSPEEVVYMVDLSPETWTQLRELTAPPETPNFLEVPWEEYSVTDGLLLLLLLFFFLRSCWNIVKEVL